MLFAATDADNSLCVHRLAILKINGEKLLQIQDDGGFLKYACLSVERVYLSDPTYV